MTTPIRWIIACLLVAASVPAALAAAREAPFCQILDRNDQPAWEAQVDYTARSSVQAPDGHGYSVYDLRGGGGLLFTEAPGGSVELAGSYAAYAFEGDGGVDLPSQVADLHLDAGYVWRNWDGHSLCVRAHPGFYGEWNAWTADAFRIPAEVIGVQTLSPRLSGQLGVAVYPGFTRAFDPRFGLRYALSDQWSVDLQYPESRLLWRAADGTEAYALIRNDPINEFWLDADDPRQSFRFEESRLAAGWAQPLGTVLRARMELGYVFNRSVDFGRQAVARSVDEAFTVGFGLGGTL